MTEGELGRANERIRECALRHRDGTHVESGIGSALASADGRLGYPVEDGIANLREHRAVVLTDPVPAEAPSEEKESVRAFYDEVGWQKADEDVFVDTARWVDRRPIVRDYVSGCRLRVNRHLEPKGRFLLDAASGPVQFPEYRSYSDGFERRICVDVSIVGLRAAKRSIRNKGIYILGDVTNLPLRDGAVDAAVSLHTIYHVPREEQATAFRELHRVLKPGGVVVIVYAWGRRGRRHRRPRRPPETDPTEPKLYSYGHDYEWFVSQNWPFRPEILVWSTVTTDFLARYVRPGRLGRQILWAIWRLEERFPHLAGRLGQYPLIVIRKTQGECGRAGHGQG
jgi:SAM-dependent methyltransferase